MSDNRITPRPFRFPTELDTGKTLGHPGQAGRSEESGDPSFTKTLGKAVSEVNELQQNASARVEEFVRGEDVPLHEVVLAQEEAEIAFRLMLEVRDRLVRAYQEVLRTPM
jgi:flagellar hook-basal body complex protein FliE